MSTDKNSEFMERKQSVAGIFGRAASTYDHVGPRFFSHFGRRLVAVAQVSQGSNVLDVASGRGAVLFPAAESVGSSGRVTGIDLSEEMVREIGREIVSSKLHNVEVQQMDAENLQFSDASFDFLLCGFAIFFFPQLDRALAEIRRVLKPNGRFATTTWDRAGDEQWKWFDDLIETYVPTEPLPDPADESQEPANPVFGTPEGLRDILASAGFSDVRITSETSDFVYADEAEWWSALWSHGARADLEEIERVAGADGLARFRADVFKKLAALKEVDGIHVSRSVLYAQGIKAQT